MRLWTIHPGYLDCKGLVALWREGLLAKKVLEGRTKGYKNHPQLDRFKGHEKPVTAINTYLLHVFNESEERGYRFNRGKLDNHFTKKKIYVSDKQVAEEFSHLKKKLRKRDYEGYNYLTTIKKPMIHPIFRIAKKIEGTQ